MNDAAMERVANQNYRLFEIIGEMSSTQVKKELDNIRLREENKKLKIDLRNTTIDLLDEIARSFNLETIHEQHRDR